MSRQSSIEYGKLNTDLSEIRDIRAYHDLMMIFNSLIELCKMAFLVEPLYTYAILKDIEDMSHPLIDGSIANSYPSASQ